MNNIQGFYKLECGIYESLYPSLEIGVITYRTDITV